MKKAVSAAAVWAVLLGFGVMTCAEEKIEKQGQVPVKGMVTMVDLGARSCVPCKMMAPILEKLEKEYKGQAAIVFIDVWQDRSQAERFGIRAIPSQIFFDTNGQEVYRHVGFMPEDAIVGQLEKMGVSRPTGKKG
jgi:thioredoxin 1